MAGDAGLTAAALAEAAWPTQRQPIDRSVVPVGVHRARRWLAEHVSDDVRIERGTEGYLLSGARVDAHHFTALAAEPGRLAEALALWRGEPLADVPVGPPALPILEALRRSHVDAATRYGRRLLTSGRAADAVEPVARLTSWYPLDEPLHAVLMEALAAIGRQAEALDHYERLRLRLADELGVDPSRQLSDSLVRVLRQDTAEVRTPVVVPMQLPRDVGGFTGRAAQLSQLDRLAASGEDGPPSILAVSGMGGVGKTTLAVRWARRAAVDFPDGQLYVDLRGYAPNAPVRPIHALGRLLRALGMPAERVPVEPDEAAAAYRSLLAGKRMLVLLDNAANAEQVRPLLPGSPLSLVLLTSRDRLDGLAVRDGARQLELDAFTPAEAIDLLTGVLDVPASAELGELAELCGRLPLALRIAAAQLRNRSPAAVGELMHTLRKNRLAALAVAGDPLSSVRAVFDLSYDRLSESDARLFRLYGAAPVADISTPATGALCDCTPAEAAQALDRLVAANLLFSVDDRYTAHDLLRDYARDRADRDEPAEHRQLAMDRLCYWYLGMADAAANRTFPNTRRLDLPARARLADSEPFAQYQAADQWLRTELHTLLTVVEHAATRGPAEISWLLCERLREFAHAEGSVDWRAAALVGLDAAIAAGDTLGQAVARNSLGNAVLTSGSPAVAGEHYLAGLHAARTADWVTGIEQALTGLGIAAIDTGDAEQARRWLTETAEFCRAHGLRRREAATYNNSGHFHWEIGELRRARELSGRALAYFRSRPDDPGTPVVFACHLSILHELGELTEALALATSICAAGTQAVSGRSRVRLWNRLADLRLDLGQFDQAREIVTDNLAITDMNNPGLAGDCLRILGRLELHARRPGQALRHLTEAHRLAALIEQPKSETEAGALLALARHRNGDSGGAVGCAQQALALAHRKGYRLDEAAALAVLARVHLDQGRLGWAATHAQRAIQISVEAGARPLVARASRVFGDVCHAQGRVDEANAQWRAAHQAFTQMGMRVDAEDTAARTVADIG